MLESAFIFYYYFTIMIWQCQSAIELIIIKKRKIIDKLRLPKYSF